jgi:hypothetical protein
MMAKSAALKPEQVPAESKPPLDAFTKDIGSARICWPLQYAMTDFAKRSGAIA